MRKLSSSSLVIHVLDPGSRTQGCESLEEGLAWLKFFTLDVDTFVVIDVCLVAMLGLVGVGESRVELDGVELEVFGSDGHYVW